jgi:hypothetical protein
MTVVVPDKEILLILKRHFILEVAADFTLYFLLQLMKWLAQRMADWAKAYLRRCSLTIVSRVNH